MLTAFFREDNELARKERPEILARGPILSLGWRALVFRDTLIRV
jgi:hypothetical protein